MNFSEFKSEDYLKLKWHFVTLGLCLLVIVGIFVGISMLDSSATRSLNIARADMNSAQTRLDQIEQEEQTILEYVAPFLAIEANGITAPKDPIDLIEKSEQIRADYHLFPVNLTTAGMADFTLPYDTSVFEPGEPVHLETSVVEVNLALLHEGDLTNFLDVMLGGPQLIVPTECRVGGSGADFRALRQNLNATCSFMWYSFNISDEDGGRL